MFRRSRALLAVLLVGVALKSALPRAQPGQAPHLDFSTYFGGSGHDEITAVHVDTAGNMYVAGTTRSADLFTGGGWIAPPPLPNQQVGFLAKIRADRSLAYATYLERPVVALAVDAAGNAIVADNISIGGGRFGTQVADVAVTKIDTTGSTVLYSTRLGGSSVDTVAAMAVDASGAVAITGQTVSGNFPLVNPLQPVRASGSVAAGDAFITKLNAQGQIVFSTGWGGIGTDAGTAIAIDGNSDIVVAGTTTSVDYLTTPGSLQRNLRNNGCRDVNRCTDAFIARLSSDGQVVRYSTFYGGSASETVRALVLDRFGSPHLTGVSESTDLPLHNAFQSTCDSARVDLYGCSSYVARLSPDGSVLRYATYFGSRSYYVSSLGQSIRALAVDTEGNLVAVGSTEGNDLPVVQAFQPVNGGGPLFKSTDEGATWTPSGSGLAGTGVWALDSAGRSLYARPLGGQLYRSDDQGRTWFLARQAGPEPGAIAVDPLTPSILYAASDDGLLKSVDGGRRWSTTSPLHERLSEVRVARSAPSNIYAISSSRGVLHSPNGGFTWSVILDMPFAPPKPYVQNIAVDPLEASAVYALLSDRSVMRRQGQQWETVSTMQCPVNQMVFEEVLPRAIYALACGKVWKSADQARTWRDMSRTAQWLSPDPARPNIIYAASATQGVYRSPDRGETWQLIREPVQDVRAILVDPAQPGTIYIGATNAQNAFVIKFNPSGAVTFGSYLGGLAAAASAVAGGPNGAIIVVGGAGREFPVVQPIQGPSGDGNGFIARIVDRE